MFIREILFYERSIKEERFWHPILNARFHLHMRRLNVQYDEHGRILENDVEDTQYVQLLGA